MSNLETLLQPNYTILTFLMIKTFFYTELIGLLGLIRALSASRASAWAGAGAFLIGAIAIAAKYVPRLANLTGTEIARSAAHVVNAGEGMALPLAATLILALSAILPGRRWWGIDALHVICAAIFFGLWGYTLL